MTQATVWDDAAESYRALYGEPDVTTPYPQAADVRIARMEAELAGMLRTEVEHAKAIHTLQHQVEAMEAKMQAWEADS